MDLSDKTVEMLVDLDEPEALLEAVRRAAGRKQGKRWLALSHVLDDASMKLEAILNAKPAGPDFTKPEPEPVNTDEEAKSA